MPTYEYVCTSCHTRTEAVQRFTDPPLETCESCGGSLKRVFHPVGIVLKGSGFYATDNRGRTSLSPGKKDGEGAKGDSSSKGDAGSKGDSGSKGDAGSKSDSKSDSSAPAKPGGGSDT